MDTHRAEAMVPLRGTEEVGRGGEGPRTSQGCRLQPPDPRQRMGSAVSMPPGVALGPSAVGREGSERLQHLK